ncbi:MAG: cysteine hydrolase [Clostridiaceae bacterium]|nr:cysteine hydrolase [Clostridiaceae bacterium]
MKGGLNVKKVLLVIDMLKDFCTEGGVLASDQSGNVYAVDIVPFVVEKTREFEDVIFICDHHEPNDLEFNRFPVHCVKGTEGAELIDELREFKDKGIVIHKQRYSSFFNTNLGELAEDYDEFHLVGVCTNICVLYTAEELCNLDKRVFVYTKGVASFDAEGHKFALQQMEQVLGAKIV